jgi:LysM repeat protein
VAIVIAIAVLAGAAYLASPAIGDWMRQVGAEATPASTSLSTPPLATPAPTPATPARTPTATRAAIPSITPPSTKPKSPVAATPLVHVVVRGETLIAIAARYGVTVSAIMNANGITEAGLIYVDERLIIPSP